MVVSRIKSANVAKSYLAAYSWKAKLLRYYMVSRLTSRRSHSLGDIGRVYVWPPFDERKDAEALFSFQQNMRYYFNNLDISIEYYMRPPESANGLIPLVMNNPAEKYLKMNFCDVALALKRFRTARYGVLWRNVGKPSGQSLRPNQYVVVEGPGCHGVVDWLRLVKDIYLSRTVMTKRSAPFPEYPVRSCAVLGTGPSIDLFDSESNQYDAWIGANAIPSDPKFRRIGQPFALCALDPYLFSSLASVKPIRDCFISFLRETPAVFITTLDYAAFIELNFPDGFKQKCRYVQVLGHDTASVRTKFDLTDMRITPYGNVLTDLMLPVATTISKSITLYGCDGRPPEGIGFFPKASRFLQVEEKITNVLTPLYPESTFCDYIERMSLYTRYVVDECLRQNVQIRIRRPSWNAGLAHLPVVN